jgi:hypothetical protein
VSGTSVALIWFSWLSRACFLQGTASVVFFVELLASTSVSFGIDFSSVANGCHKFLFGAQLPASLVAPAKQVEHFVPLAVQFRFESGEDGDGCAGERFVAFEDVEVPDSCGVGGWEVVGEQAPEQRVEEV